MDVVPGVRRRGGSGHDRRSTSRATPPSCLFHPLVFIRRVGLTLRRSGANPLPRRGTTPQAPRRTSRPEWLGRGELRQRDLVTRSRRAVRWLQPGLVVKRWMLTSGIGLLLALLGAAVWADLQPIYWTLESIKWLLARVTQVLPRGITGPLVLVSDDIGVAQLAAAELAAAGKTEVKLLEGGVTAWSKAGFPTEASPDSPPDAECIDHLFFVHDRHAGNKEAMRQYLAWETGLLAQLDAQERAEFQVKAS